MKNVDLKHRIEMYLNQKYLERDERHAAVKYSGAMKNELIHAACLGHELAVAEMNLKALAGQAPEVGDGEQTVDGQEALEQAKAQKPKRQYNRKPKPEAVSDDQA